MNIINKLKKNIANKLRGAISPDLEKFSQIEIEKFIEQQLFKNPKYQLPQYLNKYEFQAFSQFGEDGIIQEIFKRIGVTNQYFVEFGVEDGKETNSTYLLYQKWKGLWIDGSHKNIQFIEHSFSNLIKEKKLAVIRSFITAENIELLFKTASVPAEFDLLSIDIDRNDYHIWNAITAYKPRVVVIEYNAIFRPGCDFIVNYDANAIWDKTSNFGASLESLYKLGNEKGYKLVACCFAGVNAFFVREDLIKEHFTGPFTTENFYEPPRYYLLTKNGHPRKVVL